MFDENEDDYYDGDLSEEMKRFEAFLEGESIGFLDSDRWEALIDHLLMNGRYNDAILCADEALSQFSYNLLFKLRKAQSFSATGKLKEAIFLLSELERLGMDSFELLLSKGAVFSQLKDSKNAIKYFKNALGAASVEDKDEVYLDLAMEYENLGDYRAALKVLGEAVVHNPGNEAAIYEIAYCYDHLEDYESSVKCYSDFIDENPYSFTSWYNLGNAYSKLENYDKAIWAYDYCILINDDFGPVHFNMASAYLSINKYTKAIEYFLQSLELDGDDPVTYCYVGECYEQLNDLELAKKYYNHSLELAPLLPDAWLGLGIVEDLQGRTKEAIPFILKALELDPDNAGIYHVLAGAYEKLDRIKDATENYELSLALDPTDEDCLVNYVQLIAKKSSREALDYLVLFENTAPNNAIIDILKINALWDLGMKIDALELFKTCLLENREKALELYEVNPNLKNVKDFLLLSDN